MKLKLFVVYDSKTESYGVPFFRDFTANAIREWSEVASRKDDKNNQISKYPGDYTLFEIGTFEQATGLTNIYDVKTNLGLAIEHQKQEVEISN